MRAKIARATDYYSTYKVEERPVSFTTSGPFHAGQKAPAAKALVKRKEDTGAIGKADKILPQTIATTAAG